MTTIVLVTRLCLALFPYPDCPVEPPPPWQDIEYVVLTWYNPALGGINCGGSCDTLADGTKWHAGHFYQVAACLVEWRGRTVHVAGYTLLCRDSGGSIVVAWDEYYGRWIIHVDVLAPAAIPENYGLYRWVLD